ncbi:MULTISPECIES: zf-HC2 domain-containing protein [Aneurinibacillus]|jgi:anti-sigma factor RsiW|uniref:Anti-sigma-W factor RsiW n=1 Tax=Aneurinibacillus thermoaerophilus TaxID=143495 RepID=A0A1G8BSJ3_ANETH|nr:MULTISPECIES: zf-HC2 domain-containing protein [Aneurinibacillus]AMA73558.1 hypothetical protein ACH33_12285 [Aneurinibacillus sp. XH2]MED0674947.1 zf-HC2 domain-containing protein [Aneurinibacillus thermoaerophilus]MED0679652.1 zf-HC2 domain-containing protein [Aneurinibacillus thermoaerophilus]MED0737350.1 zf-HC2 domain-containing protein [Aneurinibacillus thermoaerophilus]MED0756199.1 zf-HC2 domain-containing protein [Aneurinibacillus thermoaerophilus]
MNCKTFRRLLPDYMEGKLSSSLEEEVEEHLEQCPACQEEHAVYIDSNQTFLHSPVLPAAYEHVTVSDKVMERILKENKWASPAPEHARPISPVVRRLITGFAFAALLACLLPLIMLGQQLNEAMQAMPIDTATDTVLSAEALSLVPDAGKGAGKNAQYGVIASLADPIPYSLSAKERVPRIHYGLLMALFGILVTVISMNWLSRVKKHTG